LQEKGERMKKNEPETIYKVVVNHAEAYSIWPADREGAVGLRDAGMKGTKAECLAYIAKVSAGAKPHKPHKS
jgi:MbtH protein